MIARRTLLKAIPLLALPALAKAGDGFPQVFKDDFTGGIGPWGSSGTNSIVGGVFTSTAWGYDSNHLTAYGGVGMLHLFAYIDHQQWEYTEADGRIVGCDFTNAAVRLRARGESFSANGSQFMLLIQARHPHRVGKFVNWVFTSQPRTLTNTFADITWSLAPKHWQWQWAKGQDGGGYDTFLPLADALRNLHNIHFVMLGPDNVGHPTGSFELDECEIHYNRNGPGL